MSHTDFIYFLSTGIAVIFLIFVLSVMREERLKATPVTFFKDAPDCYGDGTIFNVESYWESKCFKCKYEMFCRNSSLG